MYATDTILAALMCASRSVYSWDIVVTKAGDKLYLDKREGSNLGMWFTRSLGHVIDRYSLLL